MSFFPQRVTNEKIEMRIEIELAVLKATEIINRQTLNLH